MQTFAKTAIVSTLTGLLLGLGAVAGAHATPVGNLNDGADHTSSTTGFWSLFVHAGDHITVTARRLDPVDIWAMAYDGADGAGNQITYGDDQLSPFVGGPYGDPQFSFTANTTGEYSIGVYRCCSTRAEQLPYFVNAQGATGAVPRANDVPTPGTLALVGAGLFALGMQRRRSPAAARLQTA